MTPARPSAAAEALVHHLFLQAVELMPELALDLRSGPGGSGDNGRASNSLAPSSLWGCSFAHNRSEHPPPTNDEDRSLKQHPVAFGRADDSNSSSGQISCDRGGGKGGPRCSKGLHVLAGPLQL